jgi:hypothetical protein
MFQITYIIWLYDLVKHFKSHFISILEVHSTLMMVIMSNNISLYYHITTVLHSIDIKRRQIKHRPFYKYIVAFKRCNLMENSSTYLHFKITKLVYNFTDCIVYLFYMRKACIADRNKIFCIYEESMNSRQK